MEKWELDEKITGASKTILSYCMAHTSTSYDAEDLAQEIIRIIPAFRLPESFLSVKVW